MPTANGYSIDTLNVGDKIITKVDLDANLWGTIVKKNRATVQANYDGELFNVYPNVIVNVKPAKKATKRSTTANLPATAPVVDYSTLLDTADLLKMTGTIVVPSLDIQTVHNLPANRLWVIVGPARDTYGNVADPDRVVIVPVNDDDLERVWQCDMSQLRTVRVGLTIPMEALK